MLVGAYALSASAIKQMARAIYAAALASYITSYRANAEAAGASVPDDWQPSDTVLTALAAGAFTAARQITATYRDDLERAATSSVDDWLTTHPGADMSGPVERDLAAEVKAWADERAAWKAQQVGQYETSQAAHTATQDAASDLADGTLTDASGTVLDTSQLQVAVLPAESSGDYCANYAGRVFQFDDAPQLDFPAHIGCIHFVCYLAADGSEA